VRQPAAAPTSEITPETPRKESKARDTSVVEPVAEDQIYLFRLAHIDATSVVETIKGLFSQSGREPVVVTANEPGNVVLVSAGRKSLERIEVLIKELDVPSNAEQDHLRTHQIRVVLLANGISPDDAPGPSDEFKEVIAKLSNIGARDLRQMCQVIINTELQEEFQMESRPLLGKTASACSISGVLELRHATPVLKLQFRLQLMPGEEPSRAVNLSTIIAAPYGPYVVIGVAPVDDGTVVVLAQIEPN
jgi:hypothetical protein